jgi:hypothetical protein
MKERIIMATKQVDDKLVEIKPWGFLTLMPIKRKLLKIISGVAPDSVGLLESISEDGMDIDSIIRSIASLVEAFDEDTLNWFMTEMLKPVTIDGDLMSVEANQDKYFVKNSSFFYKIVYAVVEVNFGDFFGMLKTHSESSALEENENEL